MTLESTTLHKPDPAPVQLAMSMLGANDPSGAVLIGDSKLDIEAGLNAGVDTALALWGTREILENGIRPTYLLNKPSELLSDALRQRK